VGGSDAGIQGRRSPTEWNSLCAEGHCPGGESCPTAQGPVASSGTRGQDHGEEAKIKKKMILF